MYLYQISLNSVSCCFLFTLNAKSLGTQPFPNTLKKKKKKKKSIKNGKPHNIKYICDRTMGEPVGIRTQAHRGNKGKARRLTTTHFIRYMLWLNSVSCIIILDGRYKTGNELLEKVLLRVCLLSFNQKYKASA